MGAHLERSAASIETVAYVPSFWSNEDCRELAFEPMTTGNVDDDDCRIDLEVSFGGLDSRPHGGSISVRTEAVHFPFQSASRQNEVAWYEDNNNVDADIYYALTRNVIMIKSDTDGGVRGTSYKRFHLLD